MRKIRKRGKMVEFSDLIGKTIIHIEGLEPSNDHIKFYIDNNKYYQMCNFWREFEEDVYIKEVEGDIKDLIGTPIVEAEVVKEDSKERECLHYTFYKFRTNKDYFTITWTCNDSAFYSQDVDFEYVEED